MRQTRTGIVQRTIGTNLLWFVASVSLAFFVWVIAVTEDAQERRFSSIPIQVDYDDGMIVVDQQTRTTRVTVRAPQDVLGLLTSEDIVVRADLAGLGAGTHTVELESVISRRLVVADTQPRQITVTLEELLVQQVPVVAQIETQPPLNYENSLPVFEESQVMVSGPASSVQQVVEAQATLDLEDQRDTFDATVRLIPVDVDGNAVDDVAVEPQTVGVVVEIRRRDGLEEVAVSPDIAIGTLPDGYVISSILYDPSTVFVIGSPGELEDIPNTLFTEEIDLTNHTEDFEVEVPVILPESSPSLALVGEQTIRVSLVIDAQTTNLQLEGVPVIPVGLTEEFAIDMSPSEVSALVTGPQSVLDSLVSNQIRATVDLSGLSEGTHDVQVVAALEQTDIQSISFLPPTIEVTISMREASDTTTPDS